uniref:Uncharacterized protein n=1 Tax=Arundo donax TaxID=35708 RepID=A0A0A9FE25_ARUDO
MASPPAATRHLSPTVLGSDSAAA